MNFLWSSGSGNKVESGELTCARYQVTVEAIGWNVSLQAGQEVFSGKSGHFCPGLQCGAAYMGKKSGIVQVCQARR